MNRRAMLKTITVAGTATALPFPILGQSRGNANWRSDLLRYLESLARSDGGYGWESQEHSHLTPTFYVLGCYRVLGETPTKKSQIAEFIRTHHPGALKKLEQERRIFEFQQVQALVWLGEDASALKEKILGWKQPLAYLKQYEQHGYPLFSSEMGVILSRALLGMPANELPAAFAAYLDSRRRANGSFNNSPGADGSDGHVLSTWWALQALRVLERDVQKKDELVAWLRACQLPNGAFTFQPRPAFGGVDDAAYTWAAVRALKHLGASPAKAGACIAHLQSLANSDGGFADRPDWFSNPMATYYALDALGALNALSNVPARKSKIVNLKSPLPPDLKVFSIQLEAHGHGSPAEAVELARSLRLHFWGAKNAKPEWLARAQAVADQRQVPVNFFVSNEEYGTWVTVPGLGTYSHTSDIIAPADASIGASLVQRAPGILPGSAPAQRRGALQNSDAPARQDAGGMLGGVSWDEFRRKRLAPLEHARGRLIWQFGENEELVRMFLDDSLERGGYAAISTFHFGNPDFTNSEPFLHRWRGQIPFVALQDSHGPEPWWFADMTTGFRTVFLATAPTWEGWLNALKNNWVVAIRHDQWSAGKTWMHGGSREVLDFVRARERDWRWWENPDIQRPLVSIVAVRPDDEFEAARRDQGVTLRIRCAWENTPQGLLKQPITEFVKLSVNGSEVAPTLVSKKRPNGSLLDDHYHHLQLPELKAGKHSALVAVRVIATKEELSRTLDFSA